MRRLTDVTETRALSRIRRIEEEEAALLYAHFLRRRDSRTERRVKRDANHRSEAPMLHAFARVVIGL